jgi:glycosyltransferase involved in cell wall biosynthesis
MNKPTLTVVIPTKDEMGTIEPAVLRMPDFGVETELLFVDGNSKDGTPEELERVRAAYPHKRINWFTQEGKGKRIAVWQGFERAWGDVLIILDGDITVPPEELPAVYEHLVAGPHVFVNATRFRRRMEKGAMQAPNFAANVFFSVLISVIVGKRFTDTLCGTKGIWKSTFLALRDRSFLAGIDRYGDHELILGAWSLGCRIVEVPIHYKARLYGEAKIANQKFSGGTAFLKLDLLALKRCIFGPRGPRMFDARGDQARTTRSPNASA